MTKRETETGQWTKEQYAQIVKAFRKFAKQEATKVAVEIEKEVKFRTWGETDIYGNRFTELKKDYRDWKKKKRPGRPILFFDKEMVKSIRGVVDVTPIDDDLLEFSLDTEIPKSNKYARYKQWVHEAEEDVALGSGIRRSDMPTPVFRKFSAVTKKQAERFGVMLEETLRKKMWEWVTHNIGSD